MKRQIPVSVSQLPVACTLDDEQFQKQGLEWSDLGALSLSTERIEGGVVSTYPLNLLDRVSDLADRESGCCGSWLSVNVSQADDVVRLELTTANPDGLAVIEGMAGLGS